MAPQAKRTTLPHELLASVANEGERITDRIMSRVRPGFASGKYRGWIDAKDEQRTLNEKKDPPIWHLESECARLLRDEREALIVLMCSRFAAFGWEAFEMAYRVRHPERPPALNDHPARADRRRRTFIAETKGKAGVALGREALLRARVEGWYRPARDESPSLAELRREIGRRS